MGYRGSLLRGILEMLISVNGKPIRAHHRKTAQSNLGLIRVHLCALKAFEHLDRAQAVLAGE